MDLLLRLSKKVFFARYQRPWRWPDGVPEEGWERVAVPRNGARLAGLFATARGDEPPRGAVVLAHPMGLAAKGFWLKQGHAALLRSRGFHVLAFDFNGFGESESKDYDYPGDLIAAGEYLRGRAGDLPLAVLGSSFGAGYAVCALARAGHPYRAAVLESAFPSLPRYWRKYPVPRTFLLASQWVYPRFERELRPILAATQVKERPHVLLIHGDADDVTPPAVGKELFDAMSGRAAVELWAVPGAQHNLAFRAQPDAYADRVAAFLRRALADGDGSAA